MIKKIKSFLKEFWKKIDKLKSKKVFSKKWKKIDEYKKLNKKRKNPKKEVKRNKYNIQLNLKLKNKQTKNLIIFPIVFILIIILIIVKWTYFKIKNINVVSPDWISNTYILEKKLNYLQNKLIFKIDKQKIKNIISDIEQNIIKIEVDKKFPNSLNIRVLSSPVIFKTILKGKNYLITTNWVLIPNKSKKIDNLEIDIKNFELENYPDFKKILNKEDLHKILYLQNNLTENIVNLEIEKIIYYKTEKEVHFIINNKTRLIFDLFWDIKTGLKQLFVFNKEKINIIKPWIIYLDNRIKAKTLYCPTTEIIKCLRNINYIYWEKLKVSDYKNK